MDAAREGARRAAVVLRLQRQTRHRRAEALGHVGVAVRVGGQRRPPVDREFEPDRRVGIFAPGEAVPADRLGGGGRAQRGRDRDEAREPVVRHGLGRVVEGQLGHDRVDVEVPHHGGLVDEGEQGLLGLGEAAGVAQRGGVALHRLGVGAAVGRPADRVGEPVDAVARAGVAVAVPAHRLRAGGGALGPDQGGEAGEPALVDGGGEQVARQGVGHQLDVERPHVGRPVGPGRGDVVGRERVAGAGERLGQALVGLGGAGVVGRPGHGAAEPFGRVAASAAVPAAAVVQAVPAQRLGPRARRFGERQGGEAQHALGRQPLGQRRRRQLRHHDAAVAVAELRGVADVRVGGVLGLGEPAGVLQRQHQPAERGQVGRAVRRPGRRVAEAVDGLGGAAVAQGPPAERRGAGHRARVADHLGEAVHALGRDRVDRQARPDRPGQGAARQGRHRHGDVEVARRGGAVGVRADAAVEEVLGGVEAAEALQREAPALGHLVGQAGAAGPEPEPDQSTARPNHSAAPSRSPRP